MLRRRISRERNAGPVVLEAPGNGSPIAENGKVYLGELRTDHHGRLIVLGGRGKAAGDGPLVGFSDNPGWADDICDGPVKVKIKLHHEDREVEPDRIRNAWVVTAPPDYAPDLSNVVTLYDTMFDVAVRGLPYHARKVESVVFEAHGIVDVKRRKKPVFGQDIQPLFHRAKEIQWVYPPAFFAHDGLARLADPDDNEQAPAATASSVRCAGREPSGTSS